MTTRDTLVAARALLVDKGWTQGWFARNEKGCQVSELSPDAACFCSVGALVRAANTYDAHATFSPAIAALQTVITYSIPLWNDSPETTKDQVLAAFDKAIAAC